MTSNNYQFLKDLEDLIGSDDDDQQDNNELADNSDEFGSDASQDEPHSTQY